MKIKNNNNGLIQAVVPYKMVIIMAVMVIFASSPIFAADTIESLNTMSDKFLGLFNSSWVRALVAIAIIIEGISMVIMTKNGGGGQVVQKFLPIIIGTLIIACACGISAFLTSDMDIKAEW